MGRTKTSKLLAAKRPHLLPVFDQYVGDTLLNHKSDSDWELWRSRFEGGRGDDLRKAVQNIRDEADVPREVSTLRVLDIAIWMRMTTH
ncbi:MAG: hypothetical protein JO246_09190 [Frankiaceae bacterium]|nr:hypothetical protein [Actinomycetota bacterium]MBV9486216.1 hypothetical protein [Frankiaceae bacterium]